VYTGGSNARCVGFSTVNGAASRLHTQTHFPHSSYAVENEEFYIAYAYG
jgi:hypothetical protein